MGNSESNNAIAEAFAKDGHEFERSYRFRGGFAATAQTQASRDPQRGLAGPLGPRKRIAYLSGTPYEIGFLTGRIFSDDVDLVCTTYLEHMVPQFVSEDFDEAMADAPLMFQLIYEALISALTEHLIDAAEASFWASHKRGDIPEAFVDEMRGVVDGCVSVQTMTAVSLRRLIAVNYGMDFMVTQILSGRMLATARAALARIPEDVRNRIPELKSAFFSVPDMCNAALVAGPATASGRDAYMMRDFQFQNSFVFNRVCTILVRQPQGANLSAMVTLPGLIGGVTGLNAHGLAAGVNMVRSGAVDADHVGTGAMFALRDAMDRAVDVAGMERILRETYLGCPWLMYAIDRSGSYRVFEILPKKFGVPTAKEWVQNKQLCALIPRNLSGLAPKDPQGVWVRTERGPMDDENLQRMSAPLLKRLGHAEMAERKRWVPGGFLYVSWKDEVQAVGAVANYYFPPWRPVGVGVCVVNNSYLHPLLRLTQMNNLTSVLERVAVGNQWRYDTLSAQLHSAYGWITFETCREAIGFLSPWKQPDHPQNRKQSKYRSMFGAAEKTSAPEDVVISGAISIVDTKNMRLENKCGYWGTDYFGVTLSHYATREAR